MKTLNLTLGLSLTVSAAMAQSSFEVKKMINEYTPAGQTLLIVGSGFDGAGFSPKKGHVLFGKVAGEIVKAVSDTLYVKVPEGAVAGTEVTVATDAKQQQKVPYLYRDNRNVLFDFESGSASSYLTKGAKPGAISGKYIRVNLQIDSWVATEFVAGTLPLPADVVKSPEDFVFKFEVNTLKPFDASMIKFMIDGNYHEINTYLWKSRRTFDTRGRWETFSIPLNQIINTPLDEKAAKHKFKFSYHGDGILDCDMSFDNFRIVPKED